MAHYEWHRDAGEEHILCFDCGVSCGVVSLRRVRARGYPVLICARCRGRDGEMAKLVRAEMRRIFTDTE